MKKLALLNFLLWSCLIALHAQPVANFIAPAETCGNAPTFFENTSTGNLTFHSWIVTGVGGGGSSVPDRTLKFESYEQAIVYEVCLTVTDDQQDMDTYCQNITVYPEVPHVIKAQTLCTGESITENGTIYDEANPFGEEVYQNANGCDSVVKIALQFVTDFQIANTEIAAVPFGQSIGGSISFDAICGTAPYSYAWTPAMPGVQNQATDLSEGIYTVTVTDGNSNTVDTTFVVPAGEVMEFDVQTTPTKCEDGYDGCVQFSWSGGTPPYRIRVNGSQHFYVEAGEGFFRQRCNYWNGTYNFSIEDANGNIVVFPETLTIDFIHPHIPLSIDPASALACLGDTLELTATAPDAVSFLWNRNWPDNVECNTCPTTEIYINTLYDYFFELDVEDVNGCITSDTVYIDIEDCDPVWPGDADTNKIVDHFDLINIGLAFDSVGPTRNNASLSWLAQPANIWSQTHPNGSNYKHSDTDGNGIVNADDTLAISVNWGEMHNLTGTPPDRYADAFSAAMGNAPVPFYVEPSVIEEGETLALSVILGEMNIPADDVYGLAFSLEFDPMIVVPGSAYMAFDDSWLGMINQDMIDVQKTFHPSGKIDVGLTRTDHTNQNGFGQLAEFYITIEDDILFHAGSSDNLVSGNGETVFTISNVLAVDKEGRPLEIFPSATTTVIQATTSTRDLADPRFVKVFPNPTSDQLMIQSEEALIHHLALFSSTGELIEAKHLQQKIYTLITDELPSGIYLLRLHTSEGFVNKRITVLH